MRHTTAELIAIFLALIPAMASAQSQTANAFFFACIIAPVERDPKGSVHPHQIGPYHQLNALISEEVVPDDQHKIEAKGPLNKVLQTYDPDKILNGRAFQYYLADNSGGGSLLIGDMRLDRKDDVWMLNVSVKTGSVLPNSPPFDAMLGHLGPNFHEFDNTNTWMGWCMCIKTKNSIEYFELFNDHTKHSLDEINQKWRGQ